ncbi:hypothetical protein TcasGA2_TC010701 [Tribolium castaneum]|uniref:Uncharacterized protein n=1 Tax=Tribolium castaneum TaxID=7070 RepID=D2CG25_TRICA|nr:hypothetical protein TcasGA2_TC010701 [Tribolium castaneum]
MAAREPQRRGDKRCDGTAAVLRRLRNYDCVFVTCNTKL